MDTVTLEEVIRQRVSISPRPNGRGFFSILCKVCNDHGRKGKRAGFKFEHDHSVGYNCFNCGHTAIFIPGLHARMPRAMIEVLESLEIPSSDWEQAVFDGWANGDPHEQRDSTFIPLASIEPKELKFPPFFYKLTDDPNDDWAQCAIDYLEDRKIDWTRYPFYIVKRDKTHPYNERWYGRLIIPVYKGEKLIFWQGRDLTDMHTVKYLSPPDPKDTVLFGFDQINDQTDDPLYITEGIFDAWHLRGVATLGPKIMVPQARWLSSCRRPKVVIPDRYGDGHLLALDALELGWSVSFPDIGSCKDVNDAVKKYGELYTRTTIKENTASGFEAEARLGIYCEQSSSKKTYKKAFV